MNLLITGLLILTCYAVLLVQFYKAYKRHCTSPVDVVVKGCDIAFLNQRHILCLLAIAATVVYVGLTKSSWLMLRPALHLEPAMATLVAGVAVLIISISAARKVLHRNKLLAPVSGAPETYILIRGLFLIGYELFFRAILLQFCLVWVAVPVAIAINVVLYAVAHLFAPRQELAGTVPFGLLLCGITLFSQSILPAILLHLLLGLPHDLLLLSAPKLATKTSMS